MKKSLLTTLLVLSLAIAACEKNNICTEPVNIQNFYTNWDSTNFIGQEEALKMVVTQMNLFNNSESTVTKSNNYELLSVEIINPLTKSENNSPMFLFNFKEQRGYALISADKRDKNTIYLISANGNISSESLNDKASPYNFIYKCISNYQNFVISQYIGTPQTKASEDEELVITQTASDKGPYLKTVWEQQAPYNQTLRVQNKLPINTTVGCAPVAIGQIFTYLTSKTNVTSLTYNGNTFNMNYIRDVISEDNVKGHVDSAEIKIREVSNLLYYIGQATGTTYPYNDDKGIYEGTTLSNNISSGIKSFGFTCSNFINYNETDVKSSLNSLSPVLTNGWDSSNENGHTWVIDGYKIITNEYRTYDGDGNLIENTTLTDYNYDITETYLHCNFGWSLAKANGYYKISQVYHALGWTPRTYVYEKIFTNTNRQIADNSIAMTDFEYTTVEIMCNIK